jgi:hypothetical protein
VSFAALFEWPCLSPTESLEKLNFSYHFSESKWSESCDWPLLTSLFLLSPSLPHAPPDESAVLGKQCTLLEWGNLSSDGSIPRKLTISLRTGASRNFFQELYWSLCTHLRHVPTWESNHHDCLTYDCQISLA